MEVKKKSCVPLSAPIEWVENKLGTTQVSKYNYNATNDDLDALGRRTSVVYTGTAFSQSHW